MFLHKPLCEKYKDSTLKIFGLYVCRSCLLLYFGLILSMVATLTTIKAVNFDKYFFLGLAGCFLTFLLSYPPIYSRFHRITKDVIRFYDGIFLGAIFVISFKINIIIGLCTIGAFVIFRNIYNKKRGGERICAGCPELSKQVTCQGYAEQKNVLLEIEEEYSNIIMKHTENIK